uniref:Uncharacterized protein n=1 Tax=Anopheles albimanus TaxID=7167 RepID=A0A182FYB8_ANOAL
MITSRLMKPIMHNTCSKGKNAVISLNNRSIHNRRFSLSNCCGLQHTRCVLRSPLLTHQ